MKPLDIKTFTSLKRSNIYIWSAYDRLALSHSDSHMQVLSDKVRECGDVLTFKEFETGQTVFYQAFFCKQRFCMLCQELDFRKRLLSLDLVIRYLSHCTPKGRFLFGTLTVRDIFPEDLSKAIKDLGSAWSILQKRLYRLRLASRDPYFLGFDTVLEITYHSKSGRIVYHPHLHFIAHTSPGYMPIVPSKSGKTSHAAYHYDYLPDGSRVRVYDDQLSVYDLRRMWAEICEGYELFSGSYIVHLELCGSDRLLQRSLEKDKQLSRSNVDKGSSLALSTELVKQGKYDFSKALSEYAGKGVTKLHGLIKDPEPLFDLTYALHGVRCFRPSGSFRKAFKLIGDPDFNKAVRFDPDKMCIDAKYVILTYIYSLRDKKYHLVDE